MGKAQAVHSLRACAAVAVAATLIADAAKAAETRQPGKIAYGFNWRAEAEHGGFYQAEADGAYAKYGLDVALVPGGPTTNGQLLLSSGKLDCFMGSDMIDAMNAVAQGLPIITVAGMFQKDPQVLISHPGEGLDTFESLKSAKTIYVARSALPSYYQWLKSRWGFPPDSAAPYNFDLAPFLADGKSVQQGYATSEPFAIEKQGGFKPNVFLLADHGFDTVSTTIDCRGEFVEQRADIVQRFVDASAIGWHNYLYGDNRAANALIKQNNPDMTDEQIAYSIAKMKEYGIVDSGDALTHGIGAMSDERMKSFYEQMAAAGVLPKGLDYKKAYTLKFVNKGVGLDLQAK